MSRIRRGLDCFGIIFPKSVKYLARLKLFEKPHTVF